MRRFSSFCFAVSSFPSARSFSFLRRSFSFFAARFASASASAAASASSSAFSLARRSASAAAAAAAASSRRRSSSCIFSTAADGFGPFDFAESPFSSFAAFSLARFLSFLSLFFCESSSFVPDA